VIVEIKDLTVHYRDDDHSLLALDHVDLTIQPGRVTALVGESGSGKTTLGKALMGILPDNAEIHGSVRLGDQEIVGADETALNALRWSSTAMVFQNGAANLNPVYRLVDQVAEPLIQQREENRATANEAAEDMLVRMGLSAEQGLRYPHELSGGQVQRGLLAMALILDPPVVILDEPTAALDAITKTFVADVVSDLRRAGKSILLITHDLGLAQNLADDLAVLYLGQIMETMPAKDLLDHPQHPYTLALGRSYPDMDAVRDLGGIRGDAFYRLVHAHSREKGTDHVHTHVAAPDAYHESGHAPPQGCLFKPRCTQAVDDCGTGDIPLLDAGSHKVRCLRGGIADLLELSGIAKSYDAVEALKPTDLILRAGEVFCLVGETGSGKSTLAGIAGGALKPDQGRRIFNGRDMDDWIRRDYPSLAPKVGIIYQNPAESVSHRFTVFDAAAEPLRIQGNGLSKEEIRERVLQALTEVRLSTAPEFLKKYPHELNMGAIQRLCLARALVHDPMLLIADEPTSALDPSVQAKVLKMLLGLQTEKGLTMLFVTHDIGLARKIGDRIGVMLAGNLVEIGPASKIISNPGHPYTRMLIDAAQGRPVAPSNGGGRAGLETMGCPFAERCDQCREQCRLEFPAPVNLDGGRHLAWCGFPLHGKDEDLHKHGLYERDSLVKI
jgi:peptide/nickel transport system ATP-binding protein